MLLAADASKGSSLPRNAAVPGCTTFMQLMGTQWIITPRSQWRICITFSKKNLHETPCCITSAAPRQVHSMLFSSITVWVYAYVYISNCIFSRYSYHRAWAPVHVDSLKWSWFSSRVWKPWSFNVVPCPHRSSASSSTQHVFINSAITVWVYTYVYISNYIMIKPVDSPFPILVSPLHNLQSKWVQILMIMVFNPSDFQFGSLVLNDRSRTSSSTQHVLELVYCCLSIYSTIQLIIMMKPVD